MNRCDSFQGKEVIYMNLQILSFFVTVMANVVSYYICKWLDGNI